MGLMDEMFGVLQDVIAKPVGFLAIPLAFGLLIFGGLWWRLRRRLRRAVDALAALGADGLATGALRLGTEQTDIALLLVSLSRDLDETRRKLAAVTAEREAERDAAQQADHSKTRFLAAASHDLRQPLQALGLFVATLAQRSLPDDIKNIVDKIEGSLEALEHLLDGLLDISRLDAGAIEAHSVAFPLQSLFDRMSLEFESLAERKGLSLRLLRTGATVRSDPALLERILRNLLSNAIRYTRSGGVVVGCRRKSTGLRIEVWDSGSGIAASDQKEIFREFRQLGGNTDGERHGLGLGLAIVERLSHLLGLQIELRSRLGKGSMFAIVLPAAARPADRVKTGNAPAAPADDSSCGCSGFLHHRQ